MSVWLPQPGWLDPGLRVGQSPLGRGDQHPTDKRMKRKGSREVYRVDRVSNGLRARGLQGPAKEDEWMRHLAK